MTARAEWGVGGEGGWMGTSRPEKPNPREGGSGRVGFREEDPVTEGTT